MAVSLTDCERRGAYRSTCVVWCGGCGCAGEQVSELWWCRRGGVMCHGPTNGAASRLTFTVVTSTKGTGLACAGRVFLRLERGPRRLFLGSWWPRVATE
jgi:hypothetical protein